MKEILIYLDHGVSRRAYRHLLEAFQGHLTHFQIRSIDHRFFLTKHWEEKSALLVFPGGRDIPYQDRLQGESNARIRQYIENGGHFLGICAGAYYASAKIEFDRGGPLEIVAERELLFFPGKATGPAYQSPRFCYECASGSRAALIQWEGGITPAYFNGGCLFEEAEQHDAVDVLARYHDLEGTPAAVVLCKVALGSALLAGIHPEFTPNHFWQYLLNKILI